MTRSSSLFCRLENFGEHTAVIDELGREISYRELAARADSCVAALTTPAGARLLVAIECANALDVLLAYIGAQRAGHVVILTGPEGAGQSTGLAIQFRPNFVFRRQRDGAWRFEQTDDQPPALAPELAVLLSTSGTTGSIKLVRLSHENIEANARSIGQFLELSQKDRAPTCLPMQYSYGLSVINSHLAAGASIVLTSLSVADPDFWRLFDTRAATNFQGVPHSFQLLMQSGFIGQRHPSLRFFTQAGGRLPAPLVETFARHARAVGCKFYVMYGQTEATARMAWLPPEDALTHHDVIGQAIPGGEFWIERNGARIPDGEEGELIYSGPNVMMGYALARSDLALERTVGVLRTGDFAVRTPSGYYRIVGRAGRFIKVFGSRIDLDEVEERVRELGCTGAATGTDERLVIAVESEAAAGKAAGLVESRLGLPASACRILVTESLPRTYNGKIDYPAIAELAKLEPSPRIDSLITVARSLFREESIDGARSFVDLGGDSLSYVSFAMSVEKRLGSLPTGWERIPIRDLEQMGTRRTAKPADTRRIPIDIMLRAGAIVLVVINHFMGMGMDGSALLLMAIAGYNFSRFQVPRLVDGGGLQVLRSLFLTVLVPYFVTLIPIALVLGPDRLPNLLLMYNFVDDKVRDALPTPLIFFWYIEAYIFIVTSLTLLLLVPPLRRTVRSKPLLLPAGLFVALEVLRFSSEATRDGGVFHYTSPLMVGSVFVLGWLLHDAGKARHWSLLAVLIVECICLPHLGFTHTRWILIPGLLLLALAPPVTFRGFEARYLAPLAGLIAASSLYIYMEQFYIFSAMRYSRGLWHASHAQQVAGVFVSLLLGILIYKAIGLVTGRPRSATRIA